ncbi:hypothetical protein [Shouchella shacheensis]|uniref:hypothetical protein n=1 Tax=Shouchella shacheensis TaxID=1649580 RepID=UPI0007401E17|nr:hypothetical protein [Shouchella shacheensis]
MKKAFSIVIGAMVLVLGLSIVLGFMGIHLGGLLGLVAGAALVYWSFTMYQREGTFTLSAVVLFVLGGLIAFGGFGAMITLLIGGLMIYAGYSLIKKKSTEDGPYNHSYERTTPHKPSRRYDVIDEEYDRMMRK